MGQRFGKLDKKSLGEDTEYIEIEVGKKPRCKHFFEYMSATEIKCQMCHIGYFVSGQERLENGHLYQGDKKAL